MQIGAESCKIILKSFGKLIKSNLNVVPVGVDITREERYNFIQRFRKLIFLKND